MPVGPSHRRGGGSSRSSSRSSSSRSSSRSYSSSRSSYSSGHRHHHYYYGDSYSGGGVTISPRGWAIIGIIFGFITAIVLCFAGLALLVSNVPYYNIMKSDAPQYQEIIERAGRGDEGYYQIYITNIRWTGSSSEGGNPTEYRMKSENGTPNDYNDDAYFEAYSEVTKDGVNYYWLEISFWSEEVGERISCITYSSYPEAAVASLSSIRLAYTKEYDGDGSWDVINFSYSLKNNADYWYAGKQITNGTIMFLVALAIAGVMIWCCVLVHRAGKKAKVQTETKNSFAGVSRPTPVANLGDNSSFENQTDNARFKVCTYCGSHAKIDESNCPSCGSTKFRKAKSGDL